MTPEQITGLRIARVLVANGFSVEAAVANSAVPEAVKDFVRGILDREQIQILRPVLTISTKRQNGEWLDEIDRKSWYYWPTLRDYLIGKGWNGDAVGSIDDETDRILRQLASPRSESFDIRGLVLGYVQSGKTANFTALVAKSVDVGYRLVIVLSGIDNGLRRQTQIRLNRELVGYADNRPGAVSLPPAGRQWHQFTNEESTGDFDSGRANYASLQGTEPVLIVMKKNGSRLRRLLTWLDAAPPAVRERLPMLVIDDEADQASVDTRGDRVAQPPSPDDVIEDPSTINGLIRQLLLRFARSAYIAYTATPFANILIPHDNRHHPDFGGDLYPKDFFIALPKRDGYFGTEEFYGRLDLTSGEERPGLDVVNLVPDGDLSALDQGSFPAGLAAALQDFILAGAARRQRGQDQQPATMLVHTSSRIDDQALLSRQLAENLRELRDVWRYGRDAIEPVLRARWESEFRSKTRMMSPEYEISFDQLAPHIGRFLEVLRNNVREVNSDAGDILDYEAEPSLKVIAVGGNRLSRGLTLEGLLVSYFVRRTPMYDTLLQMGRWFGYRGGYADLTRIYTTCELKTRFHDLAIVEHQLREDIAVYERNHVTPEELGMRILRHPAMLVTSRLKQRHAGSIRVQQTYSGTLAQTFKFPFDRPEDLATQADENLALTRGFLAQAGAADWTDPKGPVWSVSGDLVLDFLRRFQVDRALNPLSPPLLSAYIERQMEQEELKSWTVAVCGREKADPRLGADGVAWGVSGGVIHPVSRTRLNSGNLNSLGIITDPKDELIGLTNEQIEQVRRLASERSLAENPTSRYVRSPETGLLLLYPISRYSNINPNSRTRRRLFDDPNDTNARDLIGLALSFPHSMNAATIFGQGTFDYVTGTVDWRAME